MITQCRIFDKTSKQMLYPQDMNRMAVFIDAAGQPVQYKGGDRFAKLQNVVVMHATSLKAEDGKTIWESDVLDVSIPTEFGSVMPARGFMQWDVFGGKWTVHIPNPPALAPVGDFPVTMARVVGNLYQQPELLNHDGAKSKVAR